VGIQALSSEATIESFDECVIGGLAWLMPAVRQMSATGIRSALLRMNTFWPPDNFEALHRLRSSQPRESTRRALPKTIQFEDIRAFRH
jgi:hypothetical protein